MMMVGMMIFVVGLFSLLLNQKHFLMLLLCFEFMNLGCLILLMLMMGEMEFFLNLILFLIVIVCEASLGLSVLVVSVYFYGNDMVGSYVLLKC
uniref:NADH-ubiquinone oxidoreductase chain 4L n=1 Tax=Ogadenus brumpti TaxID=1827023 RepID=A0A1P8AG04_9ACAR|nr:NADH dehydrogenase subunit 4L [Ogadenus brumpti]AMX74049.1 NADH dehydrogenase subunit 4L [Ogadenus brumpti]AMX74062.1 NADH dehydrogenase subunit 4L [Ogadenus brumpti]